MTFNQACKQAAKYSIQYCVWYVREVSPGVFQPYAHSSDDYKTVACFMSGKEFKED